MPKFSGGSNIVFTSDAKSVELMLLRTEMALSVGMYAFFETQMATWLSERAERRFDSEGDDVSGKWDPLAPATEKIREAGRLAGRWSVGDAHPINQRTGELKDYITAGEGDTFTGMGNTEFIYPSVNLIGGEIPDKMRTAQEGAAVKGTQARFMNPAPPRPVLGVNEVDLGFMLTALSMHVGSWSGMKI
jgi:hypothetical protein